ncbi:sugar transferase [Cryobacterium levicorallinum]|uniref:Sugar transferase n=1 Tax=Cryobacterium levicorallinum TaxID=995038 RepID=A0A1I3E0N6_9MICO|nr:sugar transferase [Cryobacterium levicorallinum]TFB81514.1 sugar transferase [Cryobacterium levicorallinum]GEP28556.1 UDP-phosphate galactose phosphotransferase [Cryobacterium levicorallinum]SFH92537.1 Sugar transferase involved in LPS biosynthesis (colanic, teichoic acid) [Cryobacterium levicorallinum]
MNRDSAGYDFAKRGGDVLFATIALVISFPVQIVIATLVAVKLGRPVLFAQPRPGLSGRIFTLYKFRTMKNVDSAEDLRTDAERLTPFGMALRATSLDELPTLINVVVGDMSLVGPRPLLVAYLDRYTAEQARRHDVRPGVTGLAQVMGRNALSWAEKFALDVYYVDHRSLAMDVFILFKTVRAVVKRDGISAADNATMPEFQSGQSGHTGALDQDRERFPASD